MTRIQYMNETNLQAPAVDGEVFCIHAPDIRVMSPHVEGKEQQMIKISEKDYSTSYQISALHLLTPWPTFHRPQITNLTMHLISVHFWTCYILELQMSLFCLFTVIGGKNVYLSLSVSGECDNKDSVWKILQKEVLHYYYNI